MSAPNGIGALVAHSALFGIITAVTVSVGFATAPTPLSPWLPLAALTAISVGLALTRLRRRHTP